MNNGPGIGGFPPPNCPNGNMMMGNQNWLNGPPPPRFNHPCPWGPPQTSRPERPNFNINQFMHPPHTNNNMQGPGPGFVQDDIFGPNTSGMQHQENFPFNGQQHNGHHGNRPQFHGPPGRGRGFMRGGRGGQQSFRGQGHQRGGYGGGPPGRGGFGGQQPNPGGKNKKKEKINKRDLPENNAFFCDSCDRGFKTEEKYKEHVDGHMKCSYKDCPYIAAPKLVQLHMSMQHRSGMAKKVWSMESEEDVKKWREDRKRNFPTAENIARKKKERSERQARGEVLETKDFSKMKGGKGRDRGRGRGGRGNGRGRGRGRWRDHDRAHENRSDAKSKTGKYNDEDSDDDDSDGPPEEVRIKRSRSPQADATAHKEENDIPKAKASKQEDTKDTSPPEQKSCAVGGLALLASYGDSSSEDEASDKEDSEIDEAGAANQAVAKNTPSPETTDHTTVTAQSQKGSTSSPRKSRELSPNRSEIKSSPPKSSLSLPSKNSSPAKKTFREPSLSDPISTSDAFSNSVETAENNSDKLEASSHMTSPKSNSVSDNGSGVSPIKKGNERGKGRNSKDGSDDNLDNDDKETSRGSKRQHSRQENGGSSAKKRKKGKPSPQPQLRKYTLLEKLLAPDIRRERNKILQCVHYIVKNKFFEGDPVNKNIVLEDIHVVASCASEKSK